MVVSQRGVPTKPQRGIHREPYLQELGLLPSHLSFEKRRLSIVRTLTLKAPVSPRAQLGDVEGSHSRPQAPINRQFSWQRSFAGRQNLQVSEPPEPRPSSHWFEPIRALLLLLEDAARLRGTAHKVSVV